MVGVAVTTAVMTAIPGLKPLVDGKENARQIH